MNFTEYQLAALETDQVPSREGDGIVVPLLGLAGEAGQLLSEYKKQLRDGEAHRLHKERVAEELGDLLWYVSDVASKYGLDLSDVARLNLEKCADRWVRAKSEARTRRLDAAYPERERFPGRFEVEIHEVSESGAVKTKAFVDGEQVGNDLTDNSYSDDGYRFHDIFHLSYAAVLGWSPVTRWLLGRKRRSIPAIDEVEDGGRAKAIEEGVAAIIFDYAQKHQFLQGISTLDYSLLKTVKSVTAHLEVSQRTAAEWEEAILAGYDVWREVERSGGAVVVVNLDEGRIYCRS